MPWGYISLKVPTQPPSCCFALHQVDRQADIGQSQGGPQAGDAPAYDHRRRDGVHHYGVEGFGEARAGDTGAHQSRRLLGGSRVIVGVRPRALLADVHLRVLIGIEAGALGDLAEGEGMQLGRARSHDDAVELLLLDVVHDLLLGGVGAGEHGRAGHDHARFVRHGGDDVVHLDMVGDVASALADIDPDPALAHADTLTFSR